MTVATKLTSLIYLLPSESPLTIVQIFPQLTISALLPKHTKKALIDFWKGSRENNPNVLEFDLELPNLLWSQIFNRWNNPHQTDWDCRCFHCGFADGAEFKIRSYNSMGTNNPYRFFVHTIDLEKSNKETILAAPFSIANTDNGYVCWGGIPYPYSLRKAYNNYWQSVHNNSPGKYPISTSGKSHVEVNQLLQKSMKEYKPAPTEWKEKKDFFLGKENLISSDFEEIPEGVFISIDPEHLEKIPSTSQNGLKRAFIAFAYFKNGEWVIKNTDVSFKLSTDKVVTR